LSVNLLKNGIGVEQARALVIILKEHSTLKSLCGNNGDETKLDISGKMNGAEDAIMLAAEITDNGTILSVNLIKNKIGVVQAKALASILKEHPTLKSLCGNSGKETELDMSGKEMDAGDAIMLVPEIVDNGALTSLDVSHNNLGALVLPEGWSEKKTDMGGWKDTSTLMEGSRKRRLGNQRALSPLPMPSPIWGR
jgi:hypothetical protein